ncbi:hypothetical protein BDQ17DRAFT_1409037 [Cyathus striatus]|nr:hypothetical protein BDQ17DRAFT_1409037 [Cyathus striatus]
MIIPSKLMSMEVTEWTADDVEEFLKANMATYQLDSQYIGILKAENIQGRPLLLLTVKDLQYIGLPIGHCKSIEWLVEELKTQKGISMPRPAKHGLPLSDEDLLSRIKRRNTVMLSPSSLAKPSIYEPMQEVLEERIFDDRPCEDDGIPPTSLLYDAFGEFLDIYDGRTDVRGLNLVNVPMLQGAVDDFAEEMCKFFANDNHRKSSGIDLLNEIFSARYNGDCIPVLIADQGTTGAQYTIYSVASIISEFRNISVGNSEIPEAKLIGRFARSIVHGMERFPNEVEGLNRIPSLGITIIAHEVKFYAILSLDTQFRIDSQPILVKFSPSHAPKLLAYQRVPGGWYGIAMEYLVDAVPIFMHEHIAEHVKAWKSDLKKLVAEFHNQGFVHGDLRDANIISGHDGRVQLVDFDWGGKDGEVSYPVFRLNPELTEGRTSQDLIIRMADDIRILDRTLEKLIQRRI